MSIFRTVEVTCPSCEATVPFDLVHSVNADRRPDLREAILDRSFQRQPCPSCGYEFRIEPEFSYMDMRRGQFLAVWPSQAVEDFETYEQRSGAASNRPTAPTPRPRRRTSAGCSRLGSSSVGSRSMRN